MGSNLSFTLTCGMAILAVLSALPSGAADGPETASPSAALPAPESLPQDDIVLTLTHGAGPGQVLLAWTGGLPFFNACSSFDYDCDLVLTPQFTQVSTTTLACGGFPPFCVDLGTGWVNGVPACGVTASYRDCSSMCGTTTINLTQRCH